MIICVPENVAIDIFVSNNQNGMATEINIKLVMVSVINGNLPQDQQEVWLLVPLHSLFLCLVSYQDLHYTIKKSTVTEL